MKLENFFLLPCYVSLPPFILFADNFNFSKSLKHNRINLQQIILAAPKIHVICEQIIYENLGVVVFRLRWRLISLDISSALLICRRPAIRLTANDHRAA